MIAGDGEPLCVCNAGAALDAGRCEVRDACTPNPCAGLPQSRCLSGPTYVRCECPEGTSFSNGVCRPETTCERLGCVGPQERCGERAGALACVCTDGFAPRTDGGCEPTPRWSCGAQHGGSAEDDAAEPDECPLLAKPIEPGPALSRRIGPAGDHDWFRIVAPSGRIVGVTVVPIDCVLAIEAFDVRGFEVVASATSDDVAPSPIFVVPPGGALLRTRAIDPTARCRYEVALNSLGLDDYGNDGTGALVLHAPATFQGALQYPSDRDVVVLAPTPGEALRLNVVGAPLPEDLVLALASADGRILTELRTTTTFNQRGNEPTLLFAAWRTPSVRSRSFTAVLESAGLDDCSDLAPFAELVPADGQDRPLWNNRGGDLDSLRIHQTAGHAYEASCRGADPCSMSVLSVSGQRLQNGAPGRLRWNASSNDDVVVQYAPSAATRYAQPAYSGALTDLGPDDHSEWPAQATQLTLGRTTAGVLTDTDDVDSFRFDAVDQRVYRVSVVQTPQVDLHEFTMKLLNPSGATAFGPTLHGLPAVMTFSPADTGSYTVVVTAGFDVHYQVLVEDLGRDDMPASIAAATMLPINTYVPGTSNFPGDLDVFGFQALAGHIYAVTCTYSVGIPCETSWLGTGSERTTVPNGTNVFAETAGAHFVEVRAGPYWPSAYSLRVEDQGLEDHGSSQVDATPFGAVGTQRTGTLGYVGDVDAFSFTPDAGRVYSIQATGAPNRQFRVTVVTGAGQQLAGSGNGANATVFAPSNQVLYALVDIQYSWAQLTPFTLSIVDVGGDDQGNSIASATPLTIGTWTTTSIDYPADIDVFSVQTIAGHAYEFRQATIPLGNWTLQTNLGEQRTIGFNSRTFGGTGATGYLILRGNGYDTGQIIFSVQDIGIDDIGDNADSGVGLALGGSASGVFEIPEDVDVFVIPLAAQQVCNITCMAGAQECWGSVTGPGGVTIPTTSGDGVTAFRAPVAGNYAFGAQGPASPYTISANLGSDDHGDSVSTASPAVLGMPNAGSFQFGGDTDYFSFQLTAGTHTIRYSSQADALTVVMVDSVNAQLSNHASMYYAESFTVPTAGTYYARVTGRSARRDYLVTVQ